MVNEENLVTEWTSGEIDYKALYEAEQEKTNQLGDKIYKLKKENKAATTETATFNETDINRILDEREFFKNNQDLLEHKEEITKYTSKGLSHEDAKILITQKDPTIANRQITQQANFTTWEPAPDTTLSQEDLAKLSPDEFKKVWEKKQKGEISII